jgi:hypothetical protein
MYCRPCSVSHEPLVAPSPQPHIEAARASRDVPLEDGTQASAERPFGIDPFIRTSRSRNTSVYHRARIWTGSSDT